MAGFVFLFLYLFYKKKDTLLHRQMELLSGLNLFGFLLGTMGGLGSLFALIVTPSLRGYNRISVFLAFICILAVAFLLNRYAEKLKPWLFSGLMVILCVVTVLEQFPNTVPNYGILKQAYLDDADFVRGIEEQVPEGSMIYQLPYHAYPEAGPVNNMNDYQLSSAFLHSDTLRWSYAGMRGRKPDVWNNVVDGLPHTERLKVLSLEGFEGIYIDNRAYREEELDRLVDELQTLLGVAPQTSRGGQLTFLPMGPYNEAYRSLYTQEERDGLKQQIEALTQILYGEGISSLENDGQEDFRWCSKVGVLTMTNDQGGTVPAKLHFKALAADGKASTFTVTVNGTRHEYQITPEGVTVDLEFKAVPGVNTVRLETEGGVYSVPNDARTLYFQIRDVSCSLTDYKLQLK